MTPISHSIVIARSQEDVFNFVTDFRNDTKWWKPVIRTRMITDGTMKVGSEFEQTAKVMFVTVKNKLIVTDWHPPQYADYINESPQLPFKLRYQFDEVEGGTRFTLIAELEMKGALGLLKPITMWTLHRQLNSFFGLLKQVLEQPQ